MFISDSDPRELRAKLFTQAERRGLTVTVVTETCYSARLDLDLRAAAVKAIVSRWSIGTTWSFAVLRTDGSEITSGGNYYNGEDALAAAIIALDALGPVGLKVPGAPTSRRRATSKRGEALVAARVAHSRSIARGLAACGVAALIALVGVIALGYSAASAPRAHAATEVGHHG